MQVHFFEDENTVRFTAHDKPDLELVTKLYNAVGYSFVAEESGGLLGVSMAVTGTRLELSLKFEREKDGQRNGG